ncbi:adenylate/guanylate cyclase domain-containing protein [Microvirga pudoricolor]|uniref:adenylate/guanylate cyclase domain-containing protein n=1 Tax=Microvirga pudoricolor TaxID=2778729 RepID=UPI00194E287C|nr:adenylate/guanylate cyclase domain-containing protein [Microvirga pudoricolor]MBM6592692.1 adenylate/guanylate cyclase domain-containing protein [Microvirga pudoricolor]
MNVPPSGPPAPESRKGLPLRDIRLASGLILGAFLVSHFANHALGLVSVEAMEAARQWFNRLWRNPAGTALLYGALATHFALALDALFRRRTLRMPPREAAQLVLGLSLPFLLVAHVVGTRVEFSVTGREVGYPDVIRNLWVLSPENGARQALALVIAWLHGCLGVYFWLRVKPWFRQWTPLLYAGALLLPVLALLGFAEAGKEIAADPDRFTFLPPRNDPTVDGIRAALMGGFTALIAGVFAARGLRSYRTLSTRVRIAYPGDRTAVVPRGFTVLEASRLMDIPHPSACGGRGRCSTCRVRIVEGLEGQPRPTPQEQATLTRIGAGPDIRLACQLRPTRDIAVVPVLSTHQPGLVASLGGSRQTGGRERELAVLFCDLRGFTRFSEDRLPFDTVFLLNRYFEIVGHAVEQSGGHLDKFIGDGALALFGLNASPEDAARQAFEAALRIVEGVRQLSDAHATELDRPLAVVVSLHAGPAILGEMGYGQASGLTAVGDTINVASRLESVAKERDVELVISAELAQRARLDLAAHERQTVTVRGRAMPVDAWIVRSAARAVQ